MIEGVATLSLIDENGKIVKKTVHKNLVTNALNNRFNPSWYAMLQNFNYSTFLAKNLPVYENCFGLLLFGEKITNEFATHTSFTKELSPVGIGGPEKLLNSGSSSAYSLNEKRGAYNFTESGPLEKIDPTNGNKGFRFVWDFGTEKISSETEPRVIISSLALTSPRAGDADLFSETKVPSGVFDNTYGGYSAPGNKAGKYLKDTGNDPVIAFTAASTKGHDSITYLGCFDGINHLYVNWNNTGTNSPLVSSGQLTFKKFFPFPKNNIKLMTTNNIYENGEKNIDISQIMTLKGVSSKYPPNFTIDTTDGYKMYLFSNLNGSGTQEWKIACINLVRLELEWSATIPSSILPSSLTNSNSVYIGYYDNKILYKATTDTAIHYCPVKHKEGELNLIKTGEAGEYNIQKYASKLTATTTPIFTLIKDKTLHLTYDTYRYVLMSDKEHSQSIFYCLGSKLTKTSYGRECYCNDNNFPNVFLSRQDCSSSSTAAFSLDVYAAVDDYYLATINNLNEEIAKTSSLSLKVQYDLIEV